MSPTLQASPGRAPLFPPGSPGAGATRVTIPIMLDAARWPRRGGRESSGEQGLHPSSRARRGRDPAGGGARLPRGQRGCSPPAHGRRCSGAGVSTQAAAQPDPRQESHSPCCPSGGAGGPDQQGAGLQGQASPVNPRAGGLSETPWSVAEGTRPWRRADDCFNPTRAIPSWGPQGPTTCPRGSHPSGPSVRPQALSGLPASSPDGLEASRGPRGERKGPPAEATPAQVPRAGTLAQGRGMAYSGLGPGSRLPPSLPQCCVASGK